MAEVGLPHAGRDDEDVVVEGEGALVGAARGDAVRLGVEFDGLAEQGGDVAIAGQLFTKRAADLPDAERSGRALVEQRLEDVTRSAIEQRDVDVGVLEAACAEESAEPAPDDHYLHPTGIHCAEPNGDLAMADRLRPMCVAQARECTARCVRSANAEVEGVGVVVRCLPGLVARARIAVV